MSSLLRYLAPLRPNPGYKVEWRHGEGGPWSPLDVVLVVPTRGHVNDLVASPPVALAAGDVVRVTNLSSVQVLDFLVQTDRGLVALPNLASKALKTGFREADEWFKAQGLDWETAWEGCNDATYLLRLAQAAGIDPRVLTLAEADCAETALAHVPSGEDRPRRAIEMARRWAQGEASEQELEAARDAAWAAAAEAGRNRLTAAGEAQYEAGYEAAEEAGHAAGDAARAQVVVGAAARSASRATAWAVFRSATRDATLDTVWGAAAEGVWLEARDAALRSMAVLVRRRIPLWQLCLAVAERVPG